MPIATDKRFHTVQSTCFNNRVYCLGCGVLFLVPVVACLGQAVYSSETFPPNVANITHTLFSVFVGECSSSGDISGDSAGDGSNNSMQTQQFIAPHHDSDHDEEPARGEAQLSHSAALQFPSGPYVQTSPPQPPIGSPIPQQTLRTQHTQPPHQSQHLPRPIKGPLLDVQEETSPEGNFRSSSGSGSSISRGGGLQALTPGDTYRQRPNQDDSFSDDSMISEVGGTTVEKQHCHG